MRGSMKVIAWVAAFLTRRARRMSIAKRERESHRQVCYDCDWSSVSTLCEIDWSDGCSRKCNKCTRSEQVATYTERHERKEEAIM